VASAAKNFLWKDYSIRDLRATAQNMMMGWSVCRVLEMRHILFLWPWRFKLIYLLNKSALQERNTITAEGWREVRNGPSNSTISVDPEWRSNVISANKYLWRGNMLLTVDSNAPPTDELKLVLCGYHVCMYCCIGIEELFCLMLLLLAMATVPIWLSVSILRYANKSINQV